MVHQMIYLTQPGIIVKVQQTPPLMARNKMVMVILKSQMVILMMRQSLKIRTLRLGFSSV